MLYFMNFWWLTALPLMILPWIWPLIQQRDPKAVGHSALFLFPAHNQSAKINWSTRHWLLKLLRSLIIGLFCVLLAGPYWMGDRGVEELQVWDDTLSVQEGNYSKPAIPRGRVLTYSEIFKRTPVQPLESDTSNEDIFPLSPGITQLETAIQKYLDDQQKPPGLMIKVHLWSDFQTSQYQHYFSSSAGFEWVMHRLSPELNEENLWIENIRIEIKHPELNEFHATITGNSQNQAVKLVITQADKVLSESLLNWKQHPLSVDIPLPAYDHSRPVKIVIVPERKEWLGDNSHFYQRNAEKQTVVALITSEGMESIYRHGLHELKALLNAEHITSFIVDTVEDLKQSRADGVILLGDHPLRWQELPQDTGFKLFIPSRLNDWKFAAQRPETDQKRNGNKNTPVDQWIISWESASLSESDSILPINNWLQKISASNLWLFRTGISPEWGSLYKDSQFAEQFSQTLQTILKENRLRLLGNFEGNSILAEIQGSPLMYWMPGTYELNQNGKTQRFSMNISKKESLAKFMSEEQIEDMSVFLKQRHLQWNRQQGQSSSDTLHWWLLWILSVLLLIEILVSLRILLIGRSNT
ncbi:MAG: BatA domain-containing protein [SAR324 cluster bacterium]|nr:BatA domain-containing protein [SAR324 cluster bacterium]